MADTEAQRIVRHAKLRASQRAAWPLVGPELRNALVAKEVLNDLYVADQPVPSTLLDEIINLLCEDPELRG